MADNPWVEGKIAVFKHNTYLLERVVPNGDDKSSVLVDFRNLQDWGFWPRDRRDTTRALCYCTIREPTDDELAHIARCRLLGEFVSG